MRNYWFTADMHFGHTNIIKYCNRPFADTLEMDNKLIENWNSVVKKDDYVYCLGDFCFSPRGHYKYYDVFARYYDKLNGIVTFIEGNHDREATKNRHRFQHYDKLLEIEINNQVIVLCHYAMKVWNKSHRGSWHLYGHSHGSLPDDPHSLSFDIGVDCHNYRPISFDEVSVIMSKKLWKPIDHHGQRLEGGGVGLSRQDYEKLERKRQYEMLKQEFGNE